VSRGARRLQGTGLYWTLILTLVVAAAIVVGIVQNSQQIRLRYLTWEGDVPLAVALLGTIVLTVALTALVGVIWRRRRRQQMADAAELLERRRQAEPPSVGTGTEEVPAGRAMTPPDAPGASR
jgi:uncharacterized integral membrane protein